MLGTLLESRHAREWHPLGTATSIGVHALVITAAVILTATATHQREAVTVEQVDLARLDQDPPKPKDDVPPPPAPADAVVAPPLAKGFQVLTAPVDVPDVIPEVDLTRPVTDEADFSGRGVEGGVARGVVGGMTTKEAGDQVFFEFQVEKPALALPNNPTPRYPTVLLQAGEEGRVLVQFVVDTTGRADMRTLRVLQSSHELFTVSVRNVLPMMRFLSAEVGGRKVRMLVQAPFEFAIQRQH